MQGQLLEKKYPRIGLGAIVVKGKEVLLGKRKGIHGSGFWAFPGGHLEWNESCEEGVAREVLEETGLHVKNIRQGPYTQDYFENPSKHYITLFWLCDWSFGEVENREPDKCELWKWFKWSELPQPLFLSIENLLTTGFHPNEKPQA